tara:strand:+ start:146 stop:931 length:786 start_codon:yes stop_codon:yes gene_type:complete
MATSEAYTATNFRVWLELQRRQEIGGDRAMNRIPLFVNEISIGTQKTVPTLPIPFGSLATGKSETLAFDMGIASKNVSLNGILLNQRVSKDTGETGNSAKDRILTPFEMAQLIHSYVDSSAAQDDQSMNKIIILIPSRIDTNFEYHTSHNPGNPSAPEGSETLDMDELPLIPFTFDNRRYDERFKRAANDFIEENTGISDLIDEVTASSFTDISEADELPGMFGFIRSFNTTFSGEQPNSVQFTLEFEVAKVLAENPINNL